MPLEATRKFVESGAPSMTNAGRFVGALASVVAHCAAVGAETPTPFVAMML